jgi:spermidine synthase
MMTVFSHISRPASPEGTRFGGAEISQTCIFKGLRKKEDVSEERSKDQTEALRDTTLSILYMLSGCCGLIYQTIWIRKFSLVFGSTIFSMSIVIAVFFGGLAIGSRLFGKLSTHTKSPVRIYAILEIIIGLYALAFPRMLEGIELVYASMYSSICHNFTILVLVKSLLACSLLLLPTVLMGGTLPILARHFVKKIPTVGSQTGLIYGLNTLGAAMGSLLAGYIFLHSLGVSKTNILAGLINLAIGVLAWRISGRTPDSNTALLEEGGSQRPDKKLIKDAPEAGLIPLIMVCFGISGFVSISYEIVWLRYLLLYLRDTSYLYSGIITIFIFGLAAGSFLFRRLVNRARHPLALFGFLQLGIGISTISAIYLPIPWHHVIVRAGEQGPVNTLFLLFLLLIVPTVLMGATFPTVARIITTEIKTVGNRIGQAYAINTLGSILGSLAVGFFFFMFMGLQTALYILFGLNMAIASILILKEGKSFNKRWAAIPLTFCCLFPICNELYFKCRVPEHIVQRISNGDDVLEIAEGLTGTAWATI